MADAWKGLKTLIGQAKSKSSSQSHLSGEEQSAFSNKLNEFYCRFERTDLDQLDSVVSRIQAEIRDDEDDFEIDGKVVESLFAN